MEVAHIFFFWIIIVAATDADLVEESTALSARRQMPVALATKETEVDDVTARISTCVYDRAAVNRCHKVGGRYWRRYLKHLRNGKSHFERCRDFTEVQKCWYEVLVPCESTQQAEYKEWEQLIKLVACACNLTTVDCRQNLRCFELEYSSGLAQSCDVSYRNSRGDLHPHQQCRLLHEAILCQEALVTSRCGAGTVTFASHLIATAYRKEIRKSRCQLVPKHRYSGFRYNDNCNEKLHYDRRMCISNHLHTALSFLDSNNLIADEDAAKIAKGCRNYRLFNKCMRPLHRNCAAAVKHLNDNDDELRTYLLKMKYICNNDHYNIYVSNLQCYTEALDNDTMNLCTKIYNEDLKHRMKRVRAYEYYCFPRLKKSKEMHRHLWRLRRCYENSFIQECNSTAGAIMGGLITKAFKDPYYLNFEYTPQCHLYTQTTYAKTTLNYSLDAKASANSRYYSSNIVVLAFFSVLKSVI